MTRPGKTKIRIPEHPNWDDFDLDEDEDEPEPDDGDFWIDPDQFTGPWN